MALSSSSSSAQDTYILNRDFFATTRLNCQHWVWHQELGYNIHPSITVPFHGRIADVATGTGAWLLEVARERPDAQCDGFDINLEQAPPTVWLPANISLRTWNMYEPPPPELIGAYDMVHIRLLTVVVRNKDTLPIIKNMALLLKPHGWLQWDEIDASDSFVVHAAGKDGNTDAMQRMDGLMKRHGAPAWIMELPSSMMKEDRFEEATMHRVKPELSLLKFHTDMILGSWVEIASNQVEGSERKREFEQLVMDVHAEARQGAAQGVSKVVCVGKKAA